MVVEARRRFGDLRVMPFMVIDVLIWPVELVVMLGATCAYVFRRIKRKRDGRRQILEAVRRVTEACNQESYVCNLCGRVASNAEVLNEKWVGMVPGGRGHRKAVWFCSQCQGPCSKTLTCVECGKTHTWDALDSTTLPFGWMTDPDEIDGMPNLARWHCPECSKKKEA
jgi:hypothetical protein